MQNELHQNLKTHLEYFYLWEKESPNEVYLYQPEKGLWRNITFSERSPCFIADKQQL